MTQQLRKRTATPNNYEFGKMDTEADPMVKGLAASDMMKASPSCSGLVMKLHVPFLYSVLPESIQRIFAKFTCFGFVSPRWDRRYLILIGEFLYKFRNEESSSPKGTPISVLTVSTDLVRANADIEPAARNPPPGFDSVVKVCSFGKTRYFAVENQEDALAWVNSLRQSRQDSITRSMGHSLNMPYPAAWKYFDSHGKDLLERKKRVKAKVEELNMRDMEVSSLQRGYFG